MSPGRISLGTFADPLTRAQADGAARAIRDEISSLKIDVVEIAPAAAHPSAGPSLARAVEALLSGQVDLVVWRAKDLPTELPPDLAVGAFLRRTNPFDVLLSQDAVTLDELDEGCRVVARAPRRRTQIASYRHDLLLVDTRGEIGRWRRELENGVCHGVVVAGDTVERLGYQELVGEILSPGVCIPAPGQGATALLARRVPAEGRDLARVLAAVNDPRTETEVAAERAVLQSLGVDVSHHVGALARLEDDVLSLEGVVVGSGEDDLVRDQVDGEPAQGAALGRELAERLLQLGASSWLRFDRSRAARSRPPAPGSDGQRVRG